MYGQGAFEFYKSGQGRVRPQRPERLFFTIFPEQQIAIYIGEFARWLSCENGLKGHPLLTDRFHVSLHHIGDYWRIRPKYTFAACEAAKTLSMPSFEVEFDQVGSFPGGKPAKRPLVLLGGSEPLVEMWETLGTGIRKMGLRTADRFTPHLTLLYDQKFLPKQAIQPIRWKVREFFLIHSHRGLTRYTTLGRWQLNG